RLPPTGSAPALGGRACPQPVAGAGAEPARPGRWMMRRFLWRAILVFGVAAPLLAASARVPEARAQSLAPPVQLLVSTSNSGKVGVATVTVKNNASEPLWEADVRCTYDPAWTLLGAWTGNTPGLNPPSVTSQPVPGPDGVGVRPVLGWINLNVPAASAV